MEEVLIQSNIESKLMLKSFLELESSIWIQNMPSMLKVDSKAIVDNDITNISRIINERTLYLEQFNFRQSYALELTLFISSFDSNKYLSTSYENHEIISFSYIPTLYQFVF